MKERVISAIVALLISVPLIILGGVYFEIFVLVIGVLGLKELLDVKKKIPNEIKIVSYIIFILLILFGYLYVGNVIIMNYTLLVITFLILLSALLVFDKGYNVEDAFYLIGSIVFLSVAFYLFIVVRDLGLNILVYLFSITIITDTFAYLIGRKYGKNKLMPKVSPNKTVEGFAGGSAVGTLLSSLIYYFFVGKIGIINIVAMTLLLSLIGQMGDLIFSSMKRHFKIKDFSNIMPGHGGILDRLDSIIFVVLSYILISVIL